MQHIIIGIDPGIIHTGCVELLIDPDRKRINVTSTVIQGVDVAKVREWIDQSRRDDWTALFIEDYNPGNYQREDKKMSEALGRLKQEFPPRDGLPIVRYVDNAGVNTLIPPAVLEVFEVDSFPVTTHHNDLVSAGKIALLGMLKDNSEGLVLRKLLSKIVEDHIYASPWYVRSRHD